MIPTNSPLLQQGAEVQNPSILVAVTMKRNPHEAAVEETGRGLGR
jgi:hypothetical protein